MRMMVASLVVAFGPMVNDAVAQTDDDHALRITGCQTDITYSVGGNTPNQNVPRVTCRLTDGGQNATRDMSNPEFSSTGFMNASILSAPWFALYAYSPAEGVCGVRFNQTTAPGVLPRVGQGGGYILWSADQISRQGQPRAASLADLRLAMPACTARLLQTYDVAIQSIAP